MDRVDPIPIGDWCRGGDDVVQVGLDVLDIGGGGVEFIEVDISLARALVVGVAVGIPPHQSPTVAGTPSHRVIEETCLRVDPIEVHEALEINRAEPVIAGPDFATGRDRGGRIRVKGHKVAVAKFHGAHGAGSARQALGRSLAVSQEEPQKDKNE